MASEGEEAGVMIHRVAEDGRGSWTHVEDLDSFFTRMYRYYRRGGFLAMLVSDALQLVQTAFVVFFVTFLVHCVNFPVLFREDPHRSNANFKNVTFSEIIYPNCSSRISYKWWTMIGLFAFVVCIRLIRSGYQLFHAYDIKLFYNKVLKIRDNDLNWLTWYAVQSRVIEAQREVQMCIHKQHIAELDIYHRILRFENYMVAMINKKLLPLYISIPFIGDIPYLSKGLKYNLELLLFYNPWSPWENCWHLRDCYKDASKRTAVAERLKYHITMLALLNLLMAPFILVWQILYFFFNYAELIKRSPESLGLRTWSLYGRISLRHFNELDHELSERLNKAHKPATKYLASFPSQIVTLIAKNVAFLCASVLSVIVAFSIYDEVVLTVDNMLTLITAIGCTLAAARSFIPDETVRQRSSEELLIQVLGFVHYLPSSWRGKAHTKIVANHFQQLFQFRAMYILIELFSPIICPIILYSVRNRALDIVDFYRNFTVSVLDIGDVCSFAQMDVRKHGNPEWPAKKEAEEQRNISHSNQGEGGKTELSLVAFSHRNPGWRTMKASQRQYLQTLHNDVMNATADYFSSNPVTHNNLGKTMLSSYYQQNNENGALFRSNFFNQYMPENQRPFVEMDENDETENDPVAGKSCPEDLVKDQQELSANTLHLYDIHLARVGQRQSRRNFVTSNEQSQSSMRHFQYAQNSEDTPLLKKTHP